MECFNRFRPLFLDALCRDEIAVAEWNEDSRSIDQAVPKLREMTGGKAEWRAIVVRVEDESAMQAYPYRPDNPYDFAIHAKDNGQPFADSPVPLIRLAKILGGMPAQEIRFEALVEEDTQSKLKHIKYEPQPDAERKALFKELAKQYAYDGVRPAELVFVTLRVPPEHNDEASLRNTWNTANESTQSSLFWRRNQYPGICRFLVFNTASEGPVRRTADYFRLWSSILLLATNNIDPSSMQAYKLYTLDTVIDKELLAESMQVLVNRLQGAHINISEAVRRELLNRLNEETELPNYSQTVSVQFPQTAAGFKSVKVSDFPRAARSIGADVNAWESTCSTQQKVVEEAFHATGKLLAQASDRVRATQPFRKQDIRKLDAYETEDLETELNRLQDKIIEQQAGLPRGKLTPEDGLQEAAKAVKQNLLTRITATQSRWWLLAAMVLFALGMAPACAVFIHKQEGANWPHAAAAVLLVIGVLALANLLVLVYRYSKLRAVIREYRKALSAVMMKLHNSGADYSRYMSDIASLFRGSSYLNLLTKSDFLRSTVISHQQDHLDAIGHLLEMLKEWDAAFRTGVNFDEDAVDDRAVIEIDTPPRKNAAYTFGSTDLSVIPLNNTGDVLMTPFRFLSKLKLEREELYDERN
jgi:hypothetical protein